MHKSIIFICLFILLIACGNDKLPKDCQEIFDTVEQFNLELDYNLNVPKYLADSHKKYLELTTKGYKKGGPVKGCKVIAEILKKNLKSLKDAKTEEEAKKVIM